MTQAPEPNAQPAAGQAAAAEAAPKIHIDIARTPEQKQRVYRFRYAVYVEEMGKKTDSYADHQRKMLCDPLDETGVIFFAESNNQLLGTLRVNRASTCPIPEEHRKIYRLDLFEAQHPKHSLSFTSRLMINKQERGSMALHMLLTYAYETGLDQDVLFDFCNCAPSLVELYEHLGYRRYMENFIDPEVGYRIPLVMMPRDAEHLKSIRSPFWRKLRTRQDRWSDPSVSAWFTQQFKLASSKQEWTIEEDDFFTFLANKYELANQSRPVPLLKGLSESESGEVLHGAVLSCKKGDPLIRAGDVGKEMFVVLSGAVEVRNARGKSLALFGPGQIIGEIAGLLQVKRTADVVAVEESEILVLTHDKIHRLMKLVPHVAARLLYNLSYILAERLVATTRMVDDTQASSPGEKKA